MTDPSAVSNGSEGYILIVEDSPVQAVLLERILKEAGFRVTKARHGEEALQHVALQPPDLIITDINMPVMDGFTMCRAIKDHPSWVTIPVILLTDLTHIHEIVLGLECGADNYIIKPYSVPEIVGKAREMMATSVTAASRSACDDPLEVEVDQHRFRIHASRQQIMNFLLSTYASTINRNSALIDAQLGLKFANDKLTESENNYRTLVQTVPDIIYRLDTEGRIVFINHAIEKLGYNIPELIGQHFSVLLYPECVENVSHRNVVAKLHHSSVVDPCPEAQPKLFDERRTHDRMTTDLEVKLVYKNSRRTMTGAMETMQSDSIFCAVNSAGIDRSDNHQQAVGYSGTVGVIRDITQRKQVEEALERVNAELQKALSTTEEANRAIIDSIRYAHRIQHALLPEWGVVQRWLPDSFVIWRPRDIIGGDLYFTQFHASGAIIVVVDCTGHGVPGAFMTMLVFSGLRQVINDHGERDPGRILSWLNRFVRSSLQQDGDKTESDDGLDAAVCALDWVKGQLTFAGAHLAMIYRTRAGAVVVQKGDHWSIGYRRSSPALTFTNHLLPLQDMMAVYLFSDGIVDQIGGPDNLPYGKQRLCEWVRHYGHEPFNQQGQHLLADFHAYIGTSEPLDDITVVGFAIPDGLVGGKT
ncbi:MAG: response regulator [Magnetococcales bacterium]|nr:response regulator [Magnetococcales bacterium]